MPFALAVTFGGAGDGGSGPSGVVIVLAVLALLIVAPAAIGLLLRLRDSRRGDDGRRDEPRSKAPPYSNALGGSWGQRLDPRRASTTADWLVVGALAVAVLAYFVSTLV